MTAAAESTALVAPARTPAPDARAEARRQAAERAKRVAAAVGNTLWRGARWTAGKVAEGYRAIDPDVRRTVVQAPLLGLMHVGPRASNVEARPNDGAPPILFLHGLGAHPGEFAAMRAAFRLLGRGRTYSVGFFANEATPVMAERVRMAIDDIVRVNELDDDAQVDIVAHSMGGLVARYALLDPATAARVRTLVTLGTPHAGTHLARLADTTKIRDLRRGSAVIDELGAQVPWPADGPRLVCLWSDADVMVQPHESATVEGAENIAVHGVTHVGFMLDPGVWRHVAQALG